jgi:hypothetical protein
MAEDGLGRGSGDETASGVGRRGFLQLSGVAAAAVIGWARDVRAQASPDKWATPPGVETFQEATLIDEVTKALREGVSCSSVLRDDRYMPVHAFPRFREAIKSHATTAPLSICGDSEPGERASVRLLVQDAAGTPIPNALIYLYHTSSKGWYSDRGYHVQANAGDEKHSRLFGYVRTAPNGAAEINTIRPAGYPDGDLPAHYHVEVLVW